MGKLADNIIVQGIGREIDVINQIRIDKYIEKISIQDVNLEKAINELNAA